MAGTTESGRKAAVTNKIRYGMDYYVVIGAQGGRASSNGGFYANRELARAAGRKGGQVSRSTVATQCHEGHEYTPDNTGKYRNGHRFCIACQKVANIASGRAIDGNLRSHREL